MTDATDRAKELNHKGRVILRALAEYDGGDEHPGAPTTYISNRTEWNSQETRYLRDTFVEDGILEEYPPIDSEGTQEEQSARYELTDFGRRVSAEVDRLVHGEGDPESIREVKETMQRLNERVSSVKHEVDDLSTSVSSLAREMDETTDRVGELEDDQSMNEERYSTLHERTVALKEKMESLEARIGEGDMR